jgi:hypothetical protein
LGRSRLPQTCPKTNGQQERKTMNKMLNFKIKNKTPKNNIKTFDLQILKRNTKENTFQTCPQQPSNR